MIEDQSLIDELEDVIANSETGRRAEVFRRVTDLFLSGSAKYSEDQVAVFGDVMGRLINEIGESTRAEFGCQLADIPNAPQNIIRKLAFDNSIDVAGAILSKSERLDEESLAECAKTMSQDHLLAISRRHSLGEVVTDVLVDRGNQEVAISVASNHGAKLSEFGYSTLIERAENDGDLALNVLTRPEISRQHALSLFTRASESVRLKLEEADRRNTKQTRNMLAHALDQVQTKTREQSPGFSAAFSLVKSLHESGKLSESHLTEFARAGKFDETVVAISLIGNLPIGVVERTIANDKSDQLLIVAKSINLSWDTAKAMLDMQAGSNNRCPRAMEKSFANFTKLRPETARKAIQFYRFLDQAENQSVN